MNVNYSERKFALTLNEKEYIIWDSHSDGYEDFYRLWYNVVECKPLFWRNTSPPSSGFKNKPSRRPAWNRSLLATFFALVSWLACFSTLQMEAKFSSETSVDFQPTTRHCVPENGTIFFLIQFWVFDGWDLHIDGWDASYTSDRTVFCMTWR
jgi:hypothetical protein